MVIITAVDHDIIRYNICGRCRTIPTSTTSGVAGLVKEDEEMAQ